MNILNFPDFTLVNRVVPKVAFYSHLEVTARMKSAFIENVEQIIWLYKLAPSNLHMADGKEVHELTIFLIKLKKGISDSSDIFRYIDSKLPRHTIFIIQQDNRYQLLVNYKQWKDASAGTFEIIKSFSTDWFQQKNYHYVWIVLLIWICSMSPWFARLPRPRLLPRSRICIKPFPKPSI